MKFCSFADVALGEGRVRAFTIFECKHLFSIIFYKWETIDQVRFHTHAFPSFAFLLWGRYDEDVIVDGEIRRRTVGGWRSWLRPRWLPRNYCHAIKRSYGFTLSMVLAGPWQKTWWEFFPAKRSERWGGIVEREALWQEYGWGRKNLGAYEGDVRSDPEQLKLDARIREVTLDLIRGRLS